MASQDLRPPEKLHVLSMSCLMDLAAAAKVTALPVCSAPYVFWIWRWKGEGFG